MAQTATQAYVNEKIVEVKNGGTVDLTHKADVVYVDDKLAQLTLNVRDFGAKGDSETDDSDSLQRAFDVGEGSKVLIPKGTYKITKKIYVHSDTIIEGVGENSVVVLGSDYELDPIVFRGTLNCFPYITTMSGSENITFRNFKIVCNKAEFKNQRHFGLGFIDTVNGIADRMIVDYINFDPESAKSFGTMVYNIATLRATKIKILGGSFEYGGYECVGVADESRDVLIDGVYSGVGWRTSLQVHRDCVNVQVVNCRIEQDHINGHSALTVHGEPGTEVDSLLIANNKISAIVAASVAAQGGIQFVTKHTRNIQVANNTVTSTNRGIMIRGVNCQINSNLVNSEFHAVDLEGDKIIMSNNILENRRSECVYIGSDSTEVFINSNQIKAEAHGIFTGHRCKTIKIVDNTVIVGTGYCFYSGQDRIILYLTISGNVFENNSQQTIALDYRGTEQLTPNWTISSNIISGSLNHRAILINANIKNPILIGNIIKKSQVGIRIANGCDYALIMSNDVSRATTPIEIVGTSNSIRQFNLEK